VTRLAAIEEKLDRRVESFGDPGDVAAQLAGTVGFPLSDGTAADAAGGGQAILGHVALLAQGADALADGLTRIGLGGDGTRLFHGSGMTQGI
jgi:hypothetical protein